MDMTTKDANMITRSVKRVFERQDIAELTKPAYEFISLHMGFIAHYDLHGFRATYEDLRLFAEKLQTSEYQNNRECNNFEADRQERDPQFNAWYGEENQKNVAWTMWEIVKIARKHEVEINRVFDARQREQEISRAAMLASKHGFQLVEVLEKPAAAEEKTAA